MKALFLLFSGTEDNCNLKHAFVFARDMVARGGEAKIVFEGASPAWLLQLPDPEHSLHGMYTRVKEEGLFAAVCRACAVQAGAVEAAQEEGLPLAADAFGHVSLAGYLDQGYQIVGL